MSELYRRRVLRRILLLDSATCAAMGALLIAGNGFIGSLTLVPSGLLLGAGIVLLPVAAFMAVVATRWLERDWASLLVIVGNAAWVVATFAVLAAIDENALGTVFLLFQAAAVAALAALEIRYRPLAAAGLAQ